jgi:hypothetical protein
MIKELETVVLSRDLPEYGLNRGDIGAVVHSYSGDQALEIEFVTGEGQTIAVVTLDAGDVRPMHANEILHVRELKAA